MTRSKNKISAAKDHSGNSSGEFCNCPRPNLKGPVSTGKKSSKTLEPTAERPSQPVLPISNPSIDLTIAESDSINMPTDSAQITPEDIFHLLQEQNERFTERWTEQAAAFSKVFETSLQASGGTSKYNSVKLPTFSGEFNDDVNEFLTNFDRAANFHNWNDLRKAQALPLHLKGNASIWFNTSPDLVDKAYPELSAALKEQFHSASDKWLLRQKLNDRKQLPTESVSEYASDIRRTCQRIDLPRSECVNYFVQGLKPEIKNYVVLQRPGTLEQEEFLDRSLSV